MKAGGLASAAGSLLRSWTSDWQSPSCSSELKKTNGLWRTSYAGPALGSGAVVAARLVWNGVGASVEQRLAEESRTVSELSGTPDALEGLRAVIERRPPKFSR